MKENTNNHLSCIKKIVIYIWAAVITISSVLAWTFGSPQNIREYFNKTEFWMGFWSNDTSYTIPPDYFDKFGFTDNGGTYAVQLIAYKSGEIDGYIMSTELCRQNPMTWEFHLESAGPGYFSLGQKRIFNLSVLSHGSYNHVATLEANIIKNDDRDQVMEFNVINNPSTYKLPPKIVLARNIPAPTAKESMDEIGEECIKVLSEFLDEFHKSQ